jgi:tRNA threonylcarbamoyladenosine biosynthesis protein TsaB
MKVLGLDTATATAGIAIVDGDRVLGEARHDTRGRGADLLVAIDALCRTIAIGPHEFDAIAVGAGPGSFTGLRIGMATAKGIAFAAQRPLWAVSSLAALADDARADDARAPDGTAPGAGDAVVCAALDARRGELFAGLYRRGTPLGPERVLAPGELAPWVMELAGDLDAVRFAGDAIEAHPDALAPLAARWHKARTPSGHAIARLALLGERVDVTVGGAPTYIRPSEAEVKYPDGVPGALRRR